MSGVQGGDVQSDNVQAGDVFGAVRSLMQEAPGEEVWAALCGLLDGVDDPAEREAIGGYLEGHLARWPDPLRVAPQAWCERALGGEAPPWWQLVRAVHLMQPTNAMIKALFKAVDVSQVTALTLENEPPTRGAGRSKSGLVKELTKAGALPQLRRLELRQGNFGDKSAELLAGAKNLTGLEELVLTRAQIEEAGYQALAASTTLPPLRALQADGPLDRALGELVTGPLLSRLEALTFNGSLRDEHLAALCEAPCVTTLRRLSFGAGYLSDDAITAALDSPLFDRLEALDLVNAGALSGAPLKALMRKPLDKLDALRLHMTPTREDVEAVCAAPMPALRQLRLRWGGDPADHEGAFEALAENPCMATLEVLELYADLIQPQEIVRIVSASRALRTLSLKRSARPGAGVDDAALERMCEAADLSKLRTLHLDGHAIEGPGLAALSHAPRLRTLTLNECPLTDAALTALPLSSLVWLDLTGSRELEGGEWVYPHPLSAAAMQALFKRAAPALQHLNLQYRDVDDDGFMALMQAGARFPALREVLLPYASITDAGLGAQQRALADGALDIPPSLQKVSMILCPHVDEGYAWHQATGLAYF